MIFGRLFADDYGLINELLGLVGVDPVGWHSERIPPSHIAIARWSTSAGPATTR